MAPHCGFRQSTSPELSTVLLRNGYAHLYLTNFNSFVTRSYLCKYQKPLRSAVMRIPETNSTLLSFKFQKVLHTLLSCEYQKPLRSGVTLKPEGTLLSGHANTRSKFHFTVMRIPEATPLCCHANTRGYSTPLSCTSLKPHPCCCNAIQHPNLLSCKFKKLLHSAVMQYKKPLQPVVMQIPEATPLCC